MTTNVSPISAQPDATNPLQPTSFRFFLQKTPEVTYFCQSANIPGISVPPVIQSNVFSDIKQPGDRVEFEDLTVEFIGYIPEDHAVPNSLRQGRSLMSFASTSNAGQDMIRLARRVLRLWDQPIPNSARQLQQYTQRLYLESSSQ